MTDEIAAVHHKTSGQEEEGSFKDDDSRLTVNQIVAFNLRRARQSKGWSQARTAAELGSLGILWSKQTFSTAERSFSRDADRDFSVNELVGLARVLDVPISYLLTPPDGCLEVHVGSPSWQVWYDDDPDWPAVWWGIDPRQNALATSASSPVRVVGPDWHTWPAPDLSRMLGDGQISTIANRLRALADEIEALQ